LNARVARRMLIVVSRVSQLNKQKVQLFVEAVVNEGRLELIDELVAADYVGYVARLERVVNGPDGVRQLVSGSRRAQPGLYVKIDDQIAEEDRVVTRWHALTTGSAAHWTGISIVRLLAGKQVDAHTESTGVAPGAR
jgi:predicted SnoaL-like aldol condensation-catalyzing enzyme